MTKGLPSIGLPRVSAELHCLQALQQRFSQATQFYQCASDKSHPAHTLRKLAQVQIIAVISTVLHASDMLKDVSVVQTQTLVKRALYVCRYDAMVAPVIHAVQTLLPKNVCHIRKPGTDDDYVLSFTDVDQLDPADIRSVTTWLEQQICRMIMMATAEVTTHSMHS